MFMFPFKEIESEFLDVPCHLEHPRKGIQYMSAIINYIFEVIFIYRGGVVKLCMRSKMYKCEHKVFTLNFNEFD